MNKFIRIKNIVIVMLCITVIAMTVGYIILCIKLDNLKPIDPNFNISFTNIKKISSIKGGTKEPIGDLKIDETGKIVKMNFILYAVHDQIDYEITVKNQGNINASVMDLITSPDFTDASVMKMYQPISINISSIGGRILEPGEEATVKLSAFYNSVDNPVDATTKKLSAKIGLLTESAQEDE